MNGAISQFFCEIAPLISVMLFAAIKISSKNSEDFTNEKNINQRGKFQG